MILIIGGAYQGKLDFARKTFGVTDAEICQCSGEDIDFSKRCISGLEHFTYACAQKGTAAADVFEAHRGAWADAILICEQINSGVVPLGADMRAWREENGRFSTWLAGEAKQVYRIFCGLPEQLK